MRRANPPAVNLAGWASSASKMIYSPCALSKPRSPSGPPSTSVFDVDVAMTALELRGPPPLLEDGSLGMPSMYVEHGMGLGVMPLLVADLAFAGSRSPFRRCGR